MFLEDLMIENFKQDLHKKKKFRDKKIQVFGWYQTRKKRDID